MAPSRKRKRQSAQSYSDRPNKQNKPHSSEESNIPPTQDSQTEYKARGILAETKTHYKIDWEDDPVTGEKYPPTWEPKRHANKELVRDWIATKRAQDKPKKKGAKSASPAQQTNKAIDTPPAKAKNERERRRPVIQSSRVEGAEPAQESAPEISPTQSNQADVDQRARGSSPLFEPIEVDDQQQREPSPRPNQEHIVSVTQPSDFDPADYDHFSQLPTSSSAQPVETQAVETQPSETQAIETPGPKESTGSLSFVVPTTVERGGVVPDSQSLPGSSSYIPSTQAQSGSKSDPHGVVRDVPSSSPTEVSQ